ncbi:hypothetical protein [Chakrabartyella piscis]|uniref:hypothetical protein n=1 Tax=Chakrabartyella piscis TaxID=2918914 RepID=UPI00295896B8|nr:hypothetical protein [Chakrabartyella piscis]
MAETKNMSVQLPIALHEKVTQHKDEQGVTLSKYVEQLISEYYELKKGGKPMSNENVRTLAVQISSELMDRLDAHLEKKGIKKKAFLTSLIEKVLEEAEKEELNHGATNAEGE